MIIRHPAVLVASVLCAVVLFGVTAGPAAANKTLFVKSCTEQAVRDAIAAAPSPATIRFRCDGTIRVTPVAGQALAVAPGRTLVIDGAGRDVTLSGGGENRILETGSGGHVTLRNLTLRDGHTGEDDPFGGGAVLSLGALTLDRVTFLDNHGYTRGGAVAMHGMAGRLDVVNSRFERNHAQCSTIGWSGGGAISLEQTAPTTIRSSTFTENGGDGGCLGGAIGAMRATRYFGLLGPVHVDRSTFTRNFLDVTAPFAIDDRSPGGGAIGVVDREVVVDRSRFSDNNVNTHFLAVGGGLYVASSARGMEQETPDRLVTVSRSQFERNHVGGRFYGIGGGIAIHGNFAPVTVTQTQLVGNIASDGGGLSTSKATTVDRSTITDNAAAGTSATTAGGISAGGVTTFIKSVVGRNTPANCRTHNAGAIVDGGGNRELDAVRTCFAQKRR